MGRPFSLKIWFNARIMLQPVNLKGAAWQPNVCLITEYLLCFHSP
jgi:hypothetical protein